MAKLKNRLQRRFWDAHSRGWDEMRSRSEALAQIGRVVDSFRARLPADASVLDLGCGPGQHAVALAAHGLQVTAVDYSTAMLERARRRALEGSFTIDFREVDLNADIALPAQAFDGVICVSVLQVIDDPSRFLMQVRDMLRPGGYLLVESVRKLGALSRGDGLRPGDRAINKLKVVVAKLMKGAVREYRPDDISDLLARVGMAVIETETYDATFTVLARR
jgi:2-polyprenyl-3-methyl-5-hydroxy-6-metoxy-1,4-benzoquinol methylase